MYLRGGDSLSVRVHSVKPERAAPRPLPACLPVQLWSRSTLTRRTLTRRRS